MADEKSAAHNLLFETRDKLASLARELDEDVPLVNPRDAVMAQIAICDILELQIRRIDELDAKG